MDEKSRLSLIGWNSSQSIVSSMSSKWQNFLKNLGEWRGSFTNLDGQGHVVNSIPSILNLESFEDDQLVRFRLRRFQHGNYELPPTSDTQQDYRSLGNQVVFFETGAFSKGSLQVAPFTPFGAEYGYVHADRRFRLVQLYTEAGDANGLVLIREFRSGSDARERPALTLEQISGRWHGKAATITADWPEPLHEESQTNFITRNSGRVQIHSELGEFKSTQEGVMDGDRIVFEGMDARTMYLLPDGGSSLAPIHVSHRKEFAVETGWLRSPDEHQRLIRRYNDRGEWISSSHLIETRLA